MTSSGHSGDGVTRVNVWSTPRTLSTALLYSFNQRPDTQAFDEPLYAHHLTKCPHLQHKRPYVQELFASQSQDGAEVVQRTILGHPTKPGATVVYAKHMAKQIVGLDLAFIAKTTNVLLIRDPVYMLTSWANKLESSLDETGYVELLQLFGKMQRAGQDIVVVDSDDLQRDAKGVLSELCRRVGIPFCEEMLQWPAGPKDVDGCWASFWYDEVHKSTGFQSTDRGNHYRRFPPELIPLLRICAPIYRALKGYAIKSAAAAERGVDGPLLDHGVMRKLGPDPVNLDVLVWVTGQGLIPREMAGISPFDSAVQGGDAVWEGLRVYNGRVFKLEAHLQRLIDSAKAMAFRGVPSKDEIKLAVFRTLAANGMRDGVHIRLTLTRGVKSISSMNPDFNIYGCTLIVLPEYKPVGGVATYDNAQGIKLITAANRRNSPQFVDSKIHHCNLINNILPKIQANVAGAADAIMLDHEGFVSETNATNIFMVKDGRMLTPHADFCLPGITRQTVIDLVQTLGIPFTERRVSLAEFHAADEVVTTGTMGELTPVAEIDGRAIGDSRQGWPIIRRIQEAYRELTESEGEPLPF